MVRKAGIEPTPYAPKAQLLPLNYSRKFGENPNRKKETILF